MKFTAVFLAVNSDETSEPSGLTPSHYAPEMAKVISRSGSRLEVGQLAIEPAAYRASLGSRTLRLSGSHLELLAYIVRNRDRVVSRDELAAVTGLEHRRSVDVALSALRRELGEGAIRNVRSRGWILEPDALTARE